MKEKNKQTERPTKGIGLQSQALESYSPHEDISEQVMNETVFSESLRK